RGGVDDGAERVQARTRRDDVAEAGVLLDDRAARGQVAGGAIAEPPAPQPDVQLLRDRELAARGPDVVAIPPRIAGDGARIRDAPAVRAEERRIAGNVLDVHRHLELGARAGRQVEAAEPLGALAPLERLAGEREVALRFVPAPDGRVDAARGPGVLPEL